MVARRKTVSPRAYSGEGVGSSTFVATGHAPLSVVRPPATPFETWREVTLYPSIDGAFIQVSGLTTRAYLDARSIVGTPETDRERELIEALAETLERLYESKADAADTVSSEEYKKEQEEHEATKERENEQEREIAKLNLAISFHGHDVAKLEEKISHYDDEIDHLKDRIANLNADLALARNRKD